MEAPVIRTIVSKGLYWGRLILGNYHLRCAAKGVGKVCSLQGLRV